MGSENASFPHRPFKVIQGRWFSDFGTNRKSVCDFLLVIRSNLGPLLQRFWDTATYWLKIANFYHLTLIWCPISGCSLGTFAVKFTRSISIMRLSSSLQWGNIHESFWHNTRWAWQTEGRIDGQAFRSLTVSTALCRQTRAYVDAL